MLQTLSSSPEISQVKAKVKVPVDLARKENARRPETAQRSPLPGLPSRQRQFPNLQEQNTTVFFIMREAILHTFTMLVSSLINTRPFVSVMIVFNAIAVNYL